MNATDNRNAIEQIDLFCLDIENEILIYGDYVSNHLIELTQNLLGFINSAPDKIKKLVEEKMRVIALKSKKYAKVWLYSAMLTVNYNPIVMEEFLECVLEEKFGPNVNYFLFYQIKAAKFYHNQLENEKNKYLNWKLLERAVEAFKDKLSDIIETIPYKQRNLDLALVITEQILGETHGPTKTAFDRCKVLIENMHKKVLLLNTAEIVSQVGMIPYYGVQGGNQIAEFLKKEYVEWKGIRIPYVQCESNMPNMESLQLLLQMVKELKPGLVILIGGSSIFGNLVDNMIPVLAVGLVPSNLEPTMCTCQTLSRKLNDEDYKLLKQMGKDEKNVIQSIFTSDLQVQKSTVCRNQLGLHEDKFVIVVIGNRLDAEIDEHFMNMLKLALDDNMEVAFVGVAFDSITYFFRIMPELQGKVHFLGFTHDILSWLEICDLYVNPHRQGGGTSAVEALFKGIPVVTTAYGDVATNVGKDFLTESYDTMPKLIQKYKTDSIFYKQMSERARKRAEILLDTKSEFLRIIREFENRTRD